MLIPFSRVVDLAKKHGISIEGVFHVGAHECEELLDYLNNGVRYENICWVEGNQALVNRLKERSIQNVYQAVVDEVSGREVTFNITNNGQSSSILELGTHQHHHPHVWVVNKQTYTTKTIKDLQIENNLDFSKYTMWNFDIQGAELKALKGAGDLLLYPRVLYLEVNSEQVYKECGLIGEIDSYVAQYGFKRLETNMTQFGWGDAVYIRSDAGPQVS